MKTNNEIKSVSDFINLSRRDKREFIKKHLDTPVKCCSNVCFICGYDDTSIIVGFEKEWEGWTEINEENMLERPEILKGYKSYGYLSTKAIEAINERKVNKPLFEQALQERAKAIQAKRVYEEISGELTVQAQSRYGVTKAGEVVDLYEQPEKEEGNMVKFKVIWEE